MGELVPVGGDECCARADAYKYSLAYAAELLRSSGKAAELLRIYPWDISETVFGNVISCSCEENVLRGFVDLCFIEHCFYFRFKVLTASVGSVFSVCKDISAFVGGDELYCRAADICSKIVHFLSFLSQEVRDWCRGYFDFSCQLALPILRHFLLSEAHFHRDTRDIPRDRAGSRRYVLRPV